jgi:hypothetical protein
MTVLRDKNVRVFVAEKFAEQGLLHRNEVDAIVSRTMLTMLASFGIEEEDRREIRADFEHLRRWRKSVEQAQSYMFRALITVIATGLVAAIWLGIKVMLGK